MKFIPYSLYPALLFLAGCGSISVQPESSDVPATLRTSPPRQILVSDFSFEGANVRADRDGKELADFKQKMNADMSRDLLHSLTPFGIPAAKATASLSKPVIPHDAWLIQGRYKRINQGSRALRSVVGFGSGGTKLEAAVEVYDLASSSTSPLFSFQTTGGSGAEPGGLLAINPEAFVLGIGGKAMSTGLSVDTRRTARMIADYVSVELANRGYIPNDRVRQPKLVDAN